MSKIVPGVKYTGQRIRELIGQSEAEELQMQGYVLRYDAMDQTYTVVPWYEATNAVMDGERPRRGGTATFNEADLPKIVKRTPEQRLNSLMVKWIEDCKQAGTIPGLSDEKIREIVGEAWKAGRTEITAEVVRMVAAHFLQQAEEKRKTDNYKKVTVDSPLT